MLPMWNDLSLESLSQYPVPYIHTVAPDERTTSDLKVGIAWAARQDHVTGLKRTVPLTDLLPLLNLPRTRFYSLQAGPASLEIEKEGAQYLIKDTEIKDFLQLADLIAEMDIVISADTAPLHLAGAMGKHCIGLMSRDASDWRWLSHTYAHAHSPWYPSMKLIRQQKVRDWTPVVDQARAMLEQFEQ